MSPLFRLVFLSIAIGSLGVLTYQDVSLVNETLLIDIIKWGDKFKGFYNIPILAGRRTLDDLDKFIVKLHTTFQRPTFMLTRRIENFTFRYHIHTDSLILVFFRGIDDMVLDMVDNFAMGRRRMCVLFVLTKPPIAHYEVHDIVMYIWNANYMHASLIYRNVQGEDLLVTFRPYSVFGTRRIPASQYKTSEVFTLKIKDSLEGYKIKSPVKADVPRVFKVKDYNGKIQIKGYGYQLFMAFVKHRNATFEEYTPAARTGESSYRKDMFELISSGEIEMSLHPQVMQPFRHVEGSYPLGINDVCLMIPMNNQIPGYMYLRRPLQRDVWLMLIFGTFYMAFIFMWVRPNSDRTPRRDYSRSLLRCIGYMLNISTWEHHSNVTWRYFFVNKSVWILGFLVSTWYCALLKSFLTTTVFGPQIDSEHDFLSSGLRILVTHFDIDDGLRMAQLNRDIRELFVATDSDTLVKHRDKLNTTYAYAVPLDRWHFFDLQQMYLHRPIFRISNICFFQHFLAYPLRQDSRLKYSLNAFLLMAHQSGLITHWWELDIEYAVRGGYAKIFTDSCALEPMDWDNFLLAWKILAVGLAASGVVFVAEVAIPIIGWWQNRNR